MSQFIVLPDSPGVEIIRNGGLGGEASGTGSHAYLRYLEVRVPSEALLGDGAERSQFAQTRIGGRRIHHPIRSRSTSQGI
jgi:acyl-CoA dehydrogenase